jgi:hypothetical protein
VTNVARERFDWAPFKSDKVTFAEPGDNIVGDVVKITTKDGRSGAVPVVTLKERGSGRTAEVWAPTHLARLLSEHDVQPGDRIAIRLASLENVGQPSRMKKFELRVAATDDADNGSSGREVPPPPSDADAPADDEPF